MTLLRTTSSRTSPPLISLSRRKPATQDEAGELSKSSQIMLAQPARKSWMFAAFSWAKVSISQIVQVPFCAEFGRQKIAPPLNGLHLRLWIILRNWDMISEDWQETFLCTEFQMFSKAPLQRSAGMDSHSSSRTLLQDRTCLSFVPQIGFVHWHFLHQQVKRERGRPTAWQEPHPSPYQPPLRCLPARPCLGLNSTDPRSQVLSVQPS